MIKFKIQFIIEKREKEKAEAKAREIELNRGIQNESYVETISGVEQSRAQSSRIKRVEIIFPN